MGCDIHMFLEKRNDDGVWEWVNTRIYDGRNYVLFSVLADVRNGSGIEPISDIRGIPEDASDKYRREVEAYGYYGHSHSYHTLQQLLDYDWSSLEWAFDSSFVSETIPRIVEIGACHEVSPEDLRIVFFFDS